MLVVAALGTVLLKRMLLENQGIKFCKKVTIWFISENPLFAKAISITFGGQWGMEAAMGKCCLSSDTPTPPQNPPQPLPQPPQPRICTIWRWGSIALQHYDDAKASQAGIHCTRGTACQKLLKTHLSQFEHWKQSLFREPPVKLWMIFMFLLVTYIFF